MDERKRRHSISTVQARQTQTKLSRSPVSTSRKEAGLKEKRPQQEYPKQSRRHSLGAVLERRSPKAKIRGSGSSSCSSEAKKKAIDLGLSQMSKRHSIGHDPTSGDGSRKPRRRDSETRSSGSEEKSPTPPPRHSLDIPRLPSSPRAARRALPGTSNHSDNSPQQQRRHSWGYAAGRYEPGSFSSISTASSISVDETKTIMARLDDARGFRSASPGGSRKLSVDDLGRMGSSAPPRLTRVRSQRRRIALLSKQGDNSQSQRSTSHRLSISSLVDKLSIDDLEGQNEPHSPRPPRHPPSPSSPSEKKQQTPVDTRARTVRTSNRSIDKLYDSIPRPRRSSKSCSPWEKARQTFSMSLPSLTLTSSESSSSSSSHESYHFKGNISLSSGATGSPPTSPRDYSGDLSFSSSSSWSESLRYSPKRMQSIASIGTEASYNLEPIKLHIPISPGTQSAKSGKRKKKRRQRRHSIGNESLPSVHSDETFAKHSRSLDYDAPAPRAESPPPPPPDTSPPSPDESHHELPIWKKLEFEKNRQKKLRERLSAARAFENPSETRKAVRAY